MAKASAPLTIYHNPGCSTSRKALALIRERGVEPEVVEYLKTGWTRPQLEGLLKTMDLGPRDILRVRGTPAEALGLTSPSVTDDAILRAMTEHPVLVERPIVAGASKAVLARPIERLEALLPST
jgi:arsenate reductase